MTMTTESVKLQYGKGPRDLARYVGLNTCKSTHAGQTTSVRTEFSYAQAWVEMSETRMVLQTTMLSAIEHHPDGPRSLGVPAPSRVKMRRTGEALDEGAPSMPCLLNDGAVAVGDQWDGAASCAFVLRQADGAVAIQSIRVPVRCRLDRIEEGTAEVRMESPELTVTAVDGTTHKLSTAAVVLFSLERGCIDDMMSYTVQQSPGEREVLNELNVVLAEYIEGEA